MSNTRRRHSTKNPSQKSQTGEIKNVLTDASLLARLVAHDPRAVRIAKFDQLSSQRELHSRVLHLLSSWGDTGSASATAKVREAQPGRLRGNAERARLLEKRLAGSSGYDWRREQKKMDGMRIMRENILLFGRLMRLRETPGPLNGERLTKEYVHKQLA